jgi:prepilin-type N-terminal cleavage/methylation domain-containing protein
LHPALEPVFRRTFLPSLTVPFAVCRTLDPRRAQARRGVTLLELLVALVLLGGLVALVAPAMGAPGPRTSDVMTVVRAARSTAIARAEPLVLTVAVSGEWTLRSLPPDDQRAVAEGRVATRPERGVRLQLSPLGACVPLTPLPSSLAGWDAASCTPAVGATFAVPSKRAGGV